MKKILLSMLVGMLSGFVYASCMGPYCWDDTGASISGVKFNGSFGGGGTPGGSNTQIQYNNNGSFAGSPNMVWDNNAETLTFGSSIVGAAIDLNQDGTFFTNDIKCYQSGTTNKVGELFGDTDGSIDLDDAGAGNSHVRIEFSSGVVIDTAKSFSVINGGAALEVRSTTRGFMPPQMSSVQRNAITPTPEGLIIYNLTTHKVEVSTAANSTSWSPLN